MCLNCRGIDARITLNCKLRKSSETTAVHVPAGRRFNNEPCVEPARVPDMLYVMYVCTAALRCPT